jgi:transketolase
MQNKTNPGLNELDELCIQTIRFLSMDGVQKAKSGHPGMPMGMASAAYTLWTKHLRHNPANPKWHGRDRFVLSAGHGSMLLYSLLYLTGYDVSLEDLKNFRQWKSKTPGHPEFGHTPGVEATTGPLGQGISNAVGMAIAQKYLAAYFNKPSHQSIGVEGKDNFNIFDYNIYVIAGDGDLQEGVSSEACSLAGHLGLNKLIVIYDDNHISIDGNTSLSFTEDRAKRFEAYNWYVQIVDGDGNDMISFEKALKNAMAEKNRPCIINLRTHIGFGSPNFQDTHKAHGAPLGEDEVKLIKKNYGWDPEKTFIVPEKALEHMQKAKAKGSEFEKQWNEKFKNYSKQFPELAKLINNPYPQITGLPTFGPDPMATRQ